MNKKILIVDNGGQYVHRIWRSLREIGTESEIVPPAKILEKLKSDDPMGLILSGGPTSVYEDTLGQSKEILNTNIPILGICWGHQFIAHSLGGKVKYGDKGEYGYGEVFVDDEDTILMGMPKKFQAWVSHRDEVVELPQGFKSLAHSETCRIEAMRHEKKPIFGVQFHPEVFHTEDGKLILKNFIEVCNG
jgi:GMP synthase (glutamine-hydrolysing)